ncbi:hypothetical protein FQN57_003800 [Myotisia sp. PD_48]|nr:hypothetical protein FQN57_003800 [Myotisia sp. PD_48]
MATTRSLRVGLAIGNGTGPELAAVFENVMQQLASRHSLDVEFVRSTRTYHSYNSLPLTQNDENSKLDICDETVNDATHYQEFCEQEAAKGLRVIFRTAISAQSLYAVRERLEAVKIELFEDQSGSIFMVRDQAQGFYTGHNELSKSRNIVSRTCRFNKDVFRHIIAFALERGRELWSDDREVVDTVLMVYKFHLFDGLLLSWAREWTQEFGVKVEFVQPDTMNRNLLASQSKGRILMVAGNEYADIMQTIFLARFNSRVQETSCAENIYLHPSLNRLSEYQTTHGSADDITGKGIVNPSATIRAVAAILEQFGQCAGIRADVDAALEILQQNNDSTPDQGGRLTTSAFVEAFLHTVGTTNQPSSNRTRRSSVSSTTAEDTPISYRAPDFGIASMGKSTAIVVVDFQNDFIATEPPDVMKNITNAISRVLAYARAHRQEVVFVQHLGDPQFQGPSWRHRNHVQGRVNLCLEGSSGAELSPALSPRSDERIFKKKAQYDPFLNGEFEAFISGRGFEHIVLMGLYADICIDATAKSAFQRGLWTTVIQDCTRPLHLPEALVFNYMQKVYGTRIVGSEAFLQMTT